ncbi:MAG: LlaJI family restriction endonuclease [Lachnospiraceae bacterium]|nr:LlaJI family restriction endonuclease [Lachnospiraceae bacterium]
MREIDIRSKCRVNSNYEMDTFVGLRCSDGDISINFPIGYHISDDNKELRKDIMLLFTTLSVNTERKESELLGQENSFDEVEFPLQSYMYIIKDFFARGCYREQEVSYKVAKTGKINWNRTIKTQKPYVQDNEVFYLDFVSKKSSIKENELITLVHEYCVYESFERIGWLFTKVMPKKPRIAKREKVFRTVLKEKISSTFNDRNRMLFRHMLAIIDFEGDKDSDKNYWYGTHRFEYVWEKMIDKVFGIENKADYFPKTIWYVNGNRYDNASLEPDTIMLYGNNVYILDAKYYKYGVTGKAWDLPESISINKQITYGEYVANEQKFKKIHGNDMKVYNAFLMPFDSLKSKYLGSPEILKVGTAVSNWKDNFEEYQKIQGILIDVKTLMNINVRQEMKEIEKLAKLIES